MTLRTQPTNWLKILFNSDTNLAPLELVELQDLILNNQKEVFNYLISPFFIVQGCNFSFIAATEAEVFFEISAGVVYINGIFYNLATTKLSCDRTSVHYLKLLPAINSIHNQISYKDPRLPATANFGIEGAGREVAELDLVLDQDGYPLYEINYTDPNLAAAQVNLFYRNEYSSINNNFKLSVADQSNLLKNLEDYWQLENKNYIVSGLAINNLESGKLNVSPGVAYIQGKKTELSNPVYLDLALDDLVNNKKYYLKFARNQINFSAYVYQNEINLGTVIKDEQNQLSLFPSQDRLVFVKDLINFNLDIARQTKQIADYQLKSQQDLVGDRIVTIVFDNLDNTDINNYFNTAKIYQSYLGLGITGRQLNLGDLAPTATANNLSINAQNQVLIEGTEVSDFIQEQLSEFMEIPPDLGNVDLTIEPQYINANLRGEHFKQQEIKLIAAGYSPNAANLNLQVNDQLINDYQIDTANSLSGLGITATELGTVNLTFVLPPDIDYETSVISLGNGFESGSANLNTFTSDVNSQNFLEGTVASSFVYQDNEIIIGVAVNLTYANSLNQILDANTSIGEIALVELGDLIADPVIAKAYIQGDDLINPASTLAKLYFTHPVKLYANKTYAFVLRSYVSDLKVAVMSLGQPVLNTNFKFNRPEFVVGNLFTKENEAWQARTRRSLKFTLLKYAPLAVKGSMNFKLNSLTNFNQLNLVKVPNQSGLITYSFEDVANNKVEIKESLNFSPTKQGTLTIDLQRNQEDYPILNLNNVEIELLSNQNESNWLSKNYTLNFVYKKVELYLEQIQPDVTTIKVFVSANQGQNWLELQIASEEILDNNINLKKVKYKLDSLSPTVELFNLDNSSVSRARKEIKFRIQLGSTNLNFLPQVFNLAALLS